MWRIPESTPLSKTSKLKLCVLCAHAQNCAVRVKIKICQLKMELNKKINCCFQSNCIFILLFKTFKRAEII